MIGHPRLAASAVGALALALGCGAEDGRPGAGDIVVKSAADTEPVRAAQREYGPYRFVGQPIVTISAALEGRDPAPSVFFRLNRRPPELRTGYADAFVTLDGASGPGIIRLRRSRNCFLQRISNSEGVESIRTAKDGQRAELVVAFRGRPRGRLITTVRMRAVSGGEGSEWAMRRLRCSRR